MAECTTTSAPSASGRCRYGVANVLSTTTRAPCSCATAHTRSDVDDRERGVGGRLDPHQRGAVGPVVLERVEIGEVRDAPLDARGTEHLRHEPVRAAVGVVGDDHALAGREQAQHGVLCGHAAREREPVRRAFERRQALLVRAGGSDCRSGRTRSRRARPTVLLDEGRRQGDRGHDRAGRRVRTPGPSWIGAGLEAVGRSDVGRTMGRARIGPGTSSTSERVRMPTG